MSSVSKAVTFIYEDLTIFLLVTLVSVVLVDEYFRRKRWSKFPFRVPSVPVIGSLYYAVGKKDCFEMYLDWFNKFHAPFYVRAFYEDFYVTVDSEETRKVILATECLNKGAPYDLFKTVTPKSILIAETNVWRPKRRFYSKSFSQMRINKLLPQVNVTSDKLVDALTARKGENFKEVFERVVLDGAMGSLLGCDEDMMKNPLLTKLDMYIFLKLLFLGITQRYTKPWLYFDFVYFQTSDGKALIEKTKAFYDAISYVMKVRREAIKNQKEEDRERDLITIAVEENMSEEEVVSDMVTFLFGAAETSAITIGLSLILLSMYEHFQEELYKEVMDVIGDTDHIDQEHLSRLRFTEMVLNETLRLFPSFPFIVRRIDRDVDLGDRVIPLNTNVIISIFGVHRSEKYWENPLEFNPYRFLPAEVEKRGPTTYMPFSVGPRNCIGGKYSMVVMKTILAKMIKKHKVSSHYKSVEEITSKIDAFVSLDLNDIDCTFTPRSQS